MGKRLDGRPRRRGWVMLFVAITLVILTGGYAYYTHETERVGRQKYDEITAIAKLKAGHIQQWRKGLLADVRVLSTGPFWKRAVNEWFREPNNDALLKDLRNRLVVGQQQGGYADALLLDLDGNVIVSASGQPESINSIEKKAIEEAVASGSPVLSDMYRTPHGSILMDAVAPIPDPKGRSIAVGLYRTNLESLLFPLIQTWPTPSQTAETLLVRRDGDDVLFLNDLRHRANTALSLREPLVHNDLPAAQAVSGKKGLFHGNDYRGVEVLADLRPIPDSPWFMVAKVDAGEILAEANYRGAVVIIFSGLFILLTAGFSAYGYRHRQAGLYQDLYQSEREQRKAEELFRTTLYSIGDAVITTDAGGLVQQMNPVAEGLTGWLEAEATGKSLDEVFHIVEEESRTPVKNPVQRVLAEGIVVGLANHTVLISRDGTERPIADSGAPIRSEDDSILGVVLVFRDQTEEKAAAEFLKESEARYRSLFENMRSAVAMYKAEQNGEDFIFVDFNAAGEKIDKINKREVIGHSVLKVFPGVKEFGLFKVFQSVWRTGESEYHPVALYKDDRTEGWRDNYVYKLPSGEIVAVYSDETGRIRAEEALRESEERYRTVADFTYHWEYWVDGEGNFLYVSPSCERITGYSAEELIGDPDLMHRIIHPDDLTKMLDHFHNVRKVVPHDVDTMDFRIIRRDGATRWIGHACQPVYGKEGQQLGRRVSNRDITDRKLAEEQARLNEARLQSLYEISQYRAKNVQEFLDFTLDHAIRLTGSKIGYIYHYDENNRRFILNTWSKEVMKQCQVAEPQNVYELEKTGLWGEVVRQKTAIIVNDYQAPNPLKKGYPPGHVELFKFMTAPIFQDDKIVAVVGVGNKKSDYDGSDVRQLSLLMDSVWRMIENQRSAEQEKLLVKAIEHAADGIIITDPDGIIQYVNPAEETITGYSRDELIGRKPSIFKTGKHEDNFYSNLWETINSGNVWSGRFINKKKDGTEYHEDASISPVYDKSENLTNFVAVKHDVTKQLTLQEQLLQAQKMEAIGTLAGGFAHDFNNKLQVINGYVDLILFNKDLPEPVKSKLGVIKQTVDSSAELIQGMMVFSRKTPVELQPIDLNKLVGQTRSMLTRSIPKVIEIDLLLADDLWSINAAPNQIDQILMNLAVNARDAMPDGGQLTIQTRNTVLDEEFCRTLLGTKPGRYVLLSVTDTGAGMDKETVGSIFVPFFTTKEAGKGTGLGLSVVYGIVELHGGRIICDSEPSVGTTFRVYFPAIEEVPQEQYSEKKEPPRGQGETILVVDDELHFVETTSRLLAGYNYRMITASNGKEALELYEKYREEIRLVVLDLIMPGMGGKECLEALRNMDPNSRVLMVSGYKEAGVASDLEAAGATGFIGKPFDMPRLLEKIRQIIDES